MMADAKSPIQRARRRRLADDAGERKRATGATSAALAEFDIGINRYRSSLRCGMSGLGDPSRKPQNSPRKTRIPVSQDPAPESATGSPTGSLRFRI
jgi:hypothetical protein